MFGTGKSTFLLRCLDTEFIAKIVPGDYNLEGDDFKKISSTCVYKRDDYSDINSMVCIFTEIFHKFFPNEDCNALKPREFLQNYPSPVCIIFI